jgi:hypothetical protein
MLDIDASGNIYLADNGGSDVYKCTDATTCSVVSVTGLDTNFNTATAFNGIQAIKLDSTGANMYVYDNDGASANIIYKCSTSTGVCATYLSPTTSLGKALDGTTDLILTMNGATSIAIDGRYYYYNYYYYYYYYYYCYYYYSGNVYVTSENENDFGDGQDIYKCTAAETCSLYLDQYSFFPHTDDDKHSLDSVYTMKVDSAGTIAILLLLFLLLLLLLIGFLYIASDSNVYRYGPDASPASSSSSFSLNAKMVSSSSSSSSSSFSY